jgi:Kef-type K+ transport system membrane component KefB
MTRTVKLHALPSMFIPAFFMGVNMANDKPMMFAFWLIVGLVFLAVALVVDT